MDPLLELIAQYSRILSHHLLFSLIFILRVVVLQYYEYSNREDYRNFYSLQRVALLVQNFYRVIPNREKIARMR